MGQTLQGLSGLCQAVCGDGGAQPDQLQLLAQQLSSATPTHTHAHVATTTTTTAADCAPSSVLLTPMASPSLAGQERDSAGTEGSGLGATKEPTGVEAATPCPRAEPAMPEQNGGEERTGDGRLRDITGAPP